MAKSQVNLIFQIIDKATGPIAKIRERMSQLDLAVKKVGQNADGTMKKMAAMEKRIKTVALSAAAVGAAMTRGISMPIAGAGTDLIKAGKDFEYGMANLKGRLKPTADEFQKMKTLSRELGVEMGVGFDGATTAMTELGKAGWNVSQILVGTKTALQLATAEGIDTGEAVGMIASVLGQFGLQAEDAARSADILAKAAGDSQISITEVRDSMKYAGVSAKQYGVTLEETAAALVILGKSGIKGEMGGTGLRSVLNSLGGDAGRQGHLASFGVKGQDIFDDKSMNSLLPLDKIAKNLKKYNLTNVQLNKAFGKEFAQVIKVLMANSDAFGKEIVELDKNSEGFLKTLADIKLETLQGALDQLSAAWRNLGAELEQAGVITFFKDTVLVIKDFVEWFTKLPGPIKTVGFVFVGFLALLGPLIGMVGFLGIAFLGLQSFAAAAGIGVGALLLTFGGWGFVIAGVIALIGTLIYKWDDLSLGIKIIIEDVKGWFAEFFDFTNFGFDSLINKFKMLLGITPIGMAARFGSNLYNGVSNMFSGDQPQNKSPIAQGPSAQQSLLRLVKPDDFISQRNDQALGTLKMEIGGMPGGSTIQGVRAEGNVQALIPLGRTARTQPTRKPSVKSGGK